MTPESIYEAWAKGFADRDIEAILALYAPDATLESPLVNNLLGTEVGVIAGRDQLRKFFGIILESTPSLKDRHRANFFTNGTVMIWEYPRVTPAGEQTDMAEVMELKDGLIQSHRIYWGWRGTKQLQKDQYRSGAR
jgi:ketosteroid isomerase-like protein